MKKFIYIIIFLALVIGCTTAKSHADNDPTKYALIIAVADYPEESQWRDISSDNDIPLIKGTLLRQGFSNDNITIITDAGAKREDIIREFEKLAKVVDPDDIVVIHFSCHGQQIQDDSNDELDGWDESMIPWDALGSEWSETYQGENHLRDDEVKVLTDNIREQLGVDGSVLMIMDACHSGTANRGMAICRGTEEVFSKPGYTFSGEPDKGNFDNDVESGHGNLAPMVTLSGSDQHQANFEYYDKEKDTSYGSLSYAFSKAMMDIGPNTTYRVLFDRISINMSTLTPRQSPQICGEVDMEIFGGKTEAPEPYFRVTKYLNETSVMINGGNLMGIYDSTEVAFYPIDTKDPDDAQAVATGTIINTSGINSRVLLNRAYDKEAISYTRVYITNQNFGDNDIYVKIDLGNNKEMEEALIARISKMPKVKITDEKPDLVVEMNNEFTRGSNHLQIITADEIVLYAGEIKSPNTENYIDIIAETINSYLQVDLIKKLEIKDSRIKATFEIIPVTYELDENKGYATVTSELDIKQFYNDGNELEFPEGQAFMFKIENHGNGRIYYQIIDIKPDNSLEVVLPSTNVWDERLPSEFVIEAKDSVILYNDLYQFLPPYGHEYLKLIATRQPIDLRMVIQSRGAKSRSNSSPLEELFRTSYTQTRSGLIKVKPSQVTVQTISLSVVEKKD